MMLERKSCPACTGSQSAEVVALPYDRPPISDYLRGFYRAYPRCDFSALAGEHYRLRRCGTCGCVFQSPVPDPSFLQRFYSEGLYADGTRTETFESYHPEHSVRELMMIVRHLQRHTPLPRVLDFGAGDGAWARLAAVTGLETHACDLSGHAYPELTRAGIVCHSPRALPASHFDLVNCEQVLEHVAEPIAEIERMSNALKVRGVLKLGVPFDPRLQKKLAAPDWLAPKDSPDSLNAVAPIEHLNHFTPASLGALCARAGLAPLRVRGWTLEPERSATGWARSALGAWVRARIGEGYRPYHRLTHTGFFVKLGKHSHAAEQS